MLFDHLEAHARFRPPHYNNEYFLKYGDEKAQVKMWLLGLSRGGAHSK